MALQDMAEGEKLLTEGGTPSQLHECPQCHRAYRRPERNHATMIVICIFTSTIAAIVASMATAHIYQTNSHGSNDPTLRLYSPANHLVEYVTRKFNRSRGDDKTPFQGWPTDEIDQTWAESYIPGLLSTLDPDTASQLPEQTERLPLKGRESEYIVTLDAFHQMHCLDIVRMALYRDRYDKHFYYPNGTVDYCKWLHVDHCLDQVRQALMCQADVSVVYYAWSNITQGMRPRVDNMHTCRNYTKILEWATGRGGFGSVPKDSQDHGGITTSNAELKTAPAEGHP
ncbi:slyX domain-containing protein [Purpureocillium lavendulum]|uniref:SlyX domain-containing protein n=1 Tax=Purpureocillium lavendulum TaxID=1247861 RepID=A0AB34FD70_9HYPO|nr:slyX domain-containing protein [Purpureocillium lavendulum]